MSTPLSSPATSQAFLKRRRSEDKESSSTQVQTETETDPPPSPISTKVDPELLSSGPAPSMSSSESTNRNARLRALILATASPPQEDQNSIALRDAIRAVQADENDDSSRALRIHQLFMERRENAIKSIADKQPTQDATFPGKGAESGCEHYARNCWIQAKCCGNYYPCRRCHDEKEDHEIDRHATEQVACIKCGEADQPVAKNCRKCDVEFARYFCKKCKFYDDTEGKEAYHCDGCGICRVGKGLGIDNHHCNGCSSCVPIDAKESHPCRERSLDANCPICAHYLATSTEPVVFMRCGHTMHVDCLTQHTASRYTCPICNKCLTDMRDWYKEMDERVSQDIIPPEYANRVSRVLCHDCGEKTVVPYHFSYHKCGDCGAYNTRVLEQFDRAADDPDRVPTPSPAVAVAARAVATPVGVVGPMIERATW